MFAPGKEQRPSAFGIISGGVIAAVVIVLLISLGLPKRDRESWKLISEGMSKQQVLDLLGTPLRQGDHPPMWLYDVGQRDYLNVGFDENNRVNWVSF